MAEVAIERLVKRFGETEVLHGISLDVADGEFVSLLGPSGCGKSTLLRSIAGLEAVTAGDIRIDGASVRRVAPRNRDIAMVFQSYALYPHMTVRENMSFGLRRRGAARSDIDGKINEAAAMLGLDAFLDRKPRELSGGQRQRVAMGRAIVREPKVFLFDEPLSNLDAALRVQMRGELKLLRQRLGVTSIYVTHDQIEAMTLSDRIVVMNAGRIEQIGRPLDLFDAPANLFVARFIGHPAINLIEGRVEDGIFRAGALALPAPGLRPGAAVLGMRPQHVRLVAPGEGDVVAEVQYTELTGVDVFAHLLADFGPLDLVTDSRIELEPGERVGLALDRARMHFFDCESGHRIAGLGS